MFQKQLWNKCQKEEPHSEGQEATTTDGDMTSAAWQVLIHFSGKYNASLFGNLCDRLTRNKLFEPEN